MSKTLLEKVWGKHVVDTLPDRTIQLYISRLYHHEVTNPQAFAGLHIRGLKPFRPVQIARMSDHNISTLSQDKPIEDPMPKNQANTLEESAKYSGLTYYGLQHPKNGIVHVVDPKTGLTQPGMTIVCDNSHTSMHGAMDTIAFGIGMSEVEVILAIQCIIQCKPKTMYITTDGVRRPGVTAEDLALHIISKMSTNGATGYFVEYAGEAVHNTTMEERLMTYNPSIEMGARGGIIAPGDVTFDYLEGHEFAPEGEEWERKVSEWYQLYSDPDAKFDKEIVFHAEDIDPMAMYDTNLDIGTSISENILSLESAPEAGRISYKKSLDYVGFRAGESVLGKKVDYVFLGSCTNSRIEDFCALASLVRGKRRAGDVTVWLAPGSWQVEQEIRVEGADKVLAEAGFVLRQPRYSAYLAINEDRVPAGKYAAFASNRNFEGRQRLGARTILTEPPVVAAAAVTSKITNLKELMQGLI